MLTLRRPGPVGTLSPGPRNGTDSAAGPTPAELITLELGGDLSAVDAPVTPALSTSVFDRKFRMQAIGEVHDALWVGPKT